MKRPRTAETLPLKSRTVGLSESAEMGNDANVTNTRRERACDANGADLCSASPVPGWRLAAHPGLVVCGPTAPNGPLAASGEVCGTITCYYDFLGNVYIFTITQPLSFIFHENWHEIND